MWASTHGDPEVVECLLALKANVNSKDRVCTV
jgi:hypothetical protein